MPAPSGPGFPVVGVGASAGGLVALTQMLDALPESANLALVVVQHLDPRHPSQLAELLQSHTTMTVVEAEHGACLERRHVYVIQPNTNVAIADGVLSVTPRPDDRRPHYPVDHFFRSLAAVKGSLAVGVVLSGTGSDGTLGVCEIKATGGVTFAQDEQSAQHAGMPQSAIASGAVDLILPPPEIGARLGTLTAHPLLDSIDQPPPDDHANGFHRVIAALRATSGVDFTQYRDTTIKRRTARRMLLRGITSAHEYAQVVERNRDEADALYRDVLINVTSFFRDPEMFDDLKGQVFPTIIAGKSDAAPIRIWVPGCSTGQEAYSIVIALLESLDDVRTKPPIQVFATDLGDPTALDKARAGVYPESIEAEVNPERLRRFFVKEGRHYRIDKSVRDLCVFARQNLTVDPPFSRVDLVTCRNVLIYMSPHLQERLLPIFHFALNPGGFLVLGLAETVGSSADLFEIINRVHKIYRRNDAAGRPPLKFVADDWLAGTAIKRTGKSVQPPTDFQREADRLLLGRYAPPSALVDQQFEVQQFRGRTAPYLEPPSGQPTTSILRMAKEGLFMDLRSALSEAKATNAPVMREALRVRDGDKDIEFTLRVLPVPVAHVSDVYFLVLFESENFPAWSASLSADDPSLPAANRDAAWLRQELASTRQYLESIVDQQDAASQELRAAHEEVLSSNEELQSTNEELETTKEELQSANEELTTVNEQFQTRNRDLDLLTDELSNFISSADLPMVTVSRDLRVRRLTPAAQRAFNLLPSDIGRSLEHIKFSLNVDGIAGIIDDVITSVQPWDREVVDRQGRWWLLRVLPFRTADNRIDGATIVAVDIDMVHHSLELLEARDNAQAVVQAVREPLVVLDSACRISLANDAYSSLLGETTEQLEGKSLWATGSGVWHGEDVRRAIEDACTDLKPVVNFEIIRSMQGRARTLIINTRTIHGANRPALVLLAIDDVTTQRQAESLRIDAETLRLVDRRKDEFLGILAHELRNPLAPMRFALELLRRAEGTPEDMTRARLVLDRQISHMVRIVDDLLDVSRITQGKVELRKERIELSQAVNAAVELCRPAVAAAQHTLTTSLPTEAVWLYADAVRLTQVFVNLLNNAVKFTPPGGHIWLIAELDDSSERPSMVRVRVRDTGVGIAEHMRARVFDMFVQGDVSLERTRAGLGVGLTLVRDLVALHGGSIEITSEGPGAGAEFVVSLPTVVSAPAEPKSDRPVATRATTRLKILVVDDSPDGRQMLTYLLTADGHEVHEARDGITALDAADRLRPDVVILDIGMPDMNGYDVARTLRRRSDGAHMTLIALTGHGQESDRSRAAAAGFDRHFTKPVDYSRLQIYLSEVPRRT